MKAKIQIFIVLIFTSAISASQSAETDSSNPIRKIHLEFSSPAGFGYHSGKNGVNALVSGLIGTDFVKQEYMVQYARDIGNLGSWGFVAGAGVVVTEDGGLLPWPSLAMTYRWF